MKKDKEINEKRNVAICWIVIGGLYLLVFGGLINMINNWKVPKKPNTEINVGKTDKSGTDYKNAMDTIRNMPSKNRGQR